MNTAAHITTKTTNNATLAQLSINRNRATNHKLTYIKGVSLLLVTLFSFYGLLMPSSSAVQQQLSNSTAKNEITTTAKTLVKANAKLTPPAMTQTTINNTQITKVLDASGYIVARRIATISSRVTGKLNQLYIEEGQYVTKNQIIAEVDNKKAKIAYQLASADLNAHKATVDEAKIDLHYQQLRLQRNKVLFKKHLISKQVNDDSEVLTAQRNARLKNKIALVSLAQQKVDLARYQLEHHKIRAPFDGVVISKNAQIGELISTGSAAGGSIRTGVATIVDMNSLEIEVEVGESYINRVHEGQTVQATLDAYPDWHINSEVIAIIPAADRQKASIKVRIKLLTKNQRIFPDMGVKVSFLKG